MPIGYDCCLYGSLLENKLIDNNDPLTKLINQEDEKGLNNEALPAYYTKNRTNTKTVTKKQHLWSINHMSLQDIKTLIEEAAEIQPDFEGATTYPERLLTSLAWSAVGAVIFSLKNIETTNHTMGNFEDKESPQYEELAARLQNHEQHYEEALQQYSFCFNNISTTKREFTTPPHILSIMTKPDNNSLNVELDMDDEIIKYVQNEIGVSDAELQMAHKLTIQKARKRREENAAWVETKRDTIQQALINAINHPQEFELSEDTYLRSLKKINAKLGEYKLDALSRMMDTTGQNKDTRVIAFSNHPIIKAMIIRTNEMVKHITTANEATTSTINDANGTPIIS